MAYAFVGSNPTPSTIDTPSGVFFIAKLRAIFISVTLNQYFCRRSSVVEHVHGKDGVPSSSLGDGSTNILDYLSD